jgi:hypothetical protein
MYSLNSGFRRAFKANEKRNEKEKSNENRPPQEMFSFWQAD